MLDLIIPVYNPEKNWQIKLTSAIIEFIDEHLSGHRDWLQLVIVNDASRTQFDGEVVRDLAESGLTVIILHNPVNKGKGFSVRRAMALSQAQYCIFTDWDLPFGITGIAQILRRLMGGADVVVGIRTKAAYFRRASFARRSVSKMLMYVNRKILALPFDDSQTGLKGFNATGRRLLLQTTVNRYLFDLEFMVLASSAQKLNISAVEVEPAENLSLTGLSTVTLLQETINLYKIIGKKRHAAAKSHLAWH